MGRVESSKQDPTGLQEERNQVAPGGAALPVPPGHPAAAMNETALMAPDLGPRREAGGGVRAGVDSGRLWAKSQVLKLGHFH